MYDAFSFIIPAVDVLSKMAFVTPVDEIDEDFFKCLICLKQLKDPKLLPCLHRCCTECLRPKLEGKEAKKFFQCPKCKYKLETTPDVLDNMKTDSYMEVLLHFIDLKRCKDLEERYCGDCENKVKLTAYCFKCQDFLCDQCCKAHLTKKVFRDHWECVVVLEDAGIQQFIDKGMAYVVKPTRCAHHSDKTADACCGTCDNVPLCIACATFNHSDKHHELSDVIDLAKEERRKLEEDVKMLEHFKADVYSVPSKVKYVREKLDDNVATRMNNIQRQYDSEEGKTTNIRRDDAKKVKDRRQALQKTEDEDVAKLTNEMESKIKEIRDKYTMLIENRKADTERELLELEGNIHGTKAAKVSNEIQTLKSELIYLQRSISKQQEENVLKLKDILEESDNIIARYENVRSTASMVFATTSKWLEILCIPYLRDAFQTLIQDSKGGYPALESLAEVDNRDLPPLSYDRDRIPDKVEDVLDVDVGREPGVGITGIANCGDGLILITFETVPGRTRDKTIKLKNSQKNHQHKIDNAPPPRGSRSKHAVAVLPFASNRLLIFDAHKGPHSRKILNPEVPNWSQDQSLVCATFDLSNQQIIMCSDSRDVNILDKKANFLFAFSLSKQITWPSDIAVHKNHLAVCDLAGRRAFIIEVNGTEAALQKEIKKPNIEGGNWGPLSACFDQQGFIYMLWEATIRGHPRCSLMQFSPDGQMLLKNKPVDTDAKFLAVSGYGETEKLVVATWRTSKLYIYELVRR